MQTATRHHSSESIERHDFPDFAAREAALAPTPFTAARQQELRRAAYLGSTRSRLWKRSPHCRYCGVRVSRRKSTIDHVVPLSRGGTDDPPNLVLCCSSCNIRKAGMTPFQWFVYTLRMAARAAAVAWLPRKAVTL